MKQNPEDLTADIKQNPERLETLKRFIGQRTIGNQGLDPERRKILALFHGMGLVYPSSCDPVDWNLEKISPGHKLENMLDWTLTSLGERVLKIVLKDVDDD